MNVSYIYFVELTLYDKNKFYLNFSENNQVTNTILFSPQKGYFTTSMFLPLDIRPNVTQSKKCKEIKELSDFGQALSKDGAKEFFNIKSIKLVSDTLRYGQKEEIFELITVKQILYNYKFNYFEINEKINKKARSALPTTILRQVVLHFKIQATKKLTM